jgi:hypothetical protein
MLRRTYTKTQKTLRNLAEVLWTNDELPQTLHDFCWCHVRLLLFHWTILFVIVDYLEATTCELLQPTPFCVQYSLKNAYQYKHLIAHRSSLIVCQCTRGLKALSYVSDHKRAARTEKQRERSDEAAESVDVSCMGERKRRARRVQHQSVSIMSWTKERGLLLSESVILKMLIVWERKAVQSNKRYLLGEGSVQWILPFVWGIKK